MKRKLSLLSLIAVLVLAMAVPCFASGLEIVEITPKDGAKGFQPMNMAVKIRFSEDMMDETAIAANQDKFEIADEEGNVQAYDIVYNASKYPDELWLVLSEELSPDASYSVNILPGVVSSSGSTLDEGLTTTFRTRNTKTDGLISMGYMAALMVIMFGVTSRAAKKKEEKEDPKAAQRALEDNLNPYKIAKEKGISVEEAQALVEKEKAKLDKKKAKAEADRIKREELKAKERQLYEEEFAFNEKEYLREEGIYRVAGPKSVKEAGGRIPRVVRQKNEARRKAAAERAKNATKNKKKK